MERLAWAKRRRETLGRRRGHPETPFIVGFFFLACVLGSGSLHVARDVRRAQIVGQTLDGSEKFLAFARGTAWGVLFFVLILVVLFVAVAISLWWEDRSWKKRER